MLIHKNKSYIFPVKYGVIFSIFTFIVYLFGVWEYPSTNRFALIVMVIIYNLSIFYGFILGTRLLKTKSSVSVSQSRLKDPNVLLKKLYMYSFWACVIMVIPRFIIFNSLYDGITIPGLIESIKASLLDVNSAYIESHFNSQSATGIWKILNYCIVLSSFLMWSYTPLTILLWKKISKTQRVVAIVYWIIYLMQYILSATNVGVISLIFILFVSFTLKRETHSGFRRIVLRARSTRAKILTYGILTIVVIFTVLNYTMTSRVGVNYETKLLGGMSIPINTSSLFWILTPDSFHPIIATLNHYIAQGYYALERSIDVDTGFTYFAGYSRFLMDNIFQYTGINIFEKSLIMNLYYDTGYHYYINWHTAYMWFANDVTLYGVPFVLFALFTFFGAAWKTFVESGNPFGFLVGVVSTYFMLFISANNSVFSNYETYIAFIFLVIVFFSTRYKYDWKKIRYE